MHSWGDKGVDWKGINDAAEYLGAYCRKWGRLGGQTKEKYGTVRFYARFGHLCLHTLIYPGYVHSRFPSWLWRLDIKLNSLYDLFEGLFEWWQKKVYSKAYINACNKWPHLQEEILSCADYPESITGRTRIEHTATEIHIHVLDLQGNTVGTRSMSKRS